MDDLEGIYAFAREEGLLVQATSYMFPPLRRDTSMVGQNDRFSPQEAAYQSACILALDLGEDEFLRRVSRDESLAFPQEIEEDCPEIDGEGDGIRCRAGKCSFWITWDGRMLPCGMFPEGNAQNVFQIGFEKAWEQVHEEALAIRLPAKCSGCTLRDQCKACAAMVMTESGNFHTVPEYRCKMAKAHGAACRQKGQEILDKRGLKS